MAKLKRLGLGALVLATATCADVSVRHVASTDFTTEGARYYLPRPYLAVKEPFPVGGEDFLTTGTLQGDRLLHIDLPAGLPAPVLRFFKANDPRVGLVAPGLVMQRRGRTAKPPGLSKQAAAPDGGASPTDAGQAPDGGSGTPSASADVEETSGSTVVPISELFDVVMLPDFDQQYAIKVSAGIGASKLKLNLKNGWMAEQIGFNVDNTAIGNFILSNIQKVVDLGIGAAQTALEPASALTAAASAFAKQAAPPEGAAPQPPAPPQVVLRVRYALEALPGLYPILKPGEKPPAGSEPSEYPILRPGEKPPAGWKPSDWVLVPYPPYTVVAYRVRETILIELVSFGAPALTGDGATLAPASKPAPSADEIKKLEPLFAGAVGKNVKKQRAAANWAVCGATAGILVINLRPSTARDLPLDMMAASAALGKTAQDKSLTACGVPIKTVLLFRPE
jgi:hypothetical protein